MIADPLRTGPRTRLRGGAEMPVLGFGTWKLDGGADVRAVREAVEEGYRLIDTASMYDDEKEVGEGLRQSGLDRGELFVTAKLWSHEHGYENALKACRRSLGKLGLDHVDLYLIHWPGGGRNIDTWKALVRLREEGRAGSIGVSDFSPEEIDGLAEATGVVPEVDQVEFGPEGHDDHLLAGCRSRGIVLDAYSPLKRTDLNDPRLAGIARRRFRTPAQAVLRWALQKGTVPLVRSSHRERMRENRDIFGSSLSPEDIGTIDRLGRP